MSIFTSCNEGNDSMILASLDIFYEMVADFFAPEVQKALGTYSATSCNSSAFVQQQVVKRQEHESFSYVF